MAAILIVEHRAGKECPNCGKKKFSYDSFEDMYCCLSCDVFLYPDEIGQKDNKHAEIHQK
jgi:predicted RNA-binding Zn-ribbon protein involved in translation (DUF1610 family)